MILRYCSRTHGPITPASPQVHPRIIQRIVEIREHPPENLQRTPGPRAILSYSVVTRRCRLNVSLFRAPRVPSGASCGSLDVSWMHLIVLAVHKSVPILWKSFNSLSRMRPACRLILLASSSMWVEVLNCVDAGTFTWLQAEARTDFHAETANARCRRLPSPIWVSALHDL
jgi:hypothetical protein